jgi:PAS domain S-box-containing protein
VHATRDNTWSFATKLQLYSAVLVVTVAVLITGVMYVLGFQAINAREKATLQGEAALDAALIQTPFILMRQDAELFSESMLTKRILQPGEFKPPGNATHFATQDPVYGLQRALNVLLTTRPYYFQARLIGLSDNGRELVRVERVDGTVIAVTGDDLQEKGEESYMRDLLVRQGPFFTAVSFNREHGAVDSRNLPTIRYVRPIRNTTGEILGALVLNADYQALLRHANVAPPKDHTVTVINAQGDHFEFHADPRDNGLQFHADSAFSKSKFTGDGGVFDPDHLHRSDLIAFHHAFALDETEGGETIDVIVSVPKQVFIAPTASALRGALLLACALLLAALVLSWLIGQRISRPLVQLTEALRNRGPGFGDLDVVIGRRDEFGSLAATFKRLTVDLLEQTAETLAIVGHAPDGIVTFDGNGRILRCNTAFEQIFGAQQSGLDLVDMRRLLRDEAPLMALLTAEGADAAPFDCGQAAVGRRLDGTEFPMECSVSRIEGRGGIRYVAVIRDISERRAAEGKLMETMQALEAAKEAALRSNAELDSFAYVASHDLRAPLRVIRNAASWLAEDLGDTLSKESQENIGLMRSRVDRMDRLLIDLLEHSRIGRATQDTRLMSGADLIDDIAHLAALPDGFTLDASEAVNRLILPRMPLKTVLMNLVSNAVKHHDKSQGRIEIDVARGDDGGLTFSVTDDGPGIAPEYHERIFEMFQTLKSRDRVEGSGMGLAIVRKTVAHVGGDIWLRSAPGEGCTVSFTWPHGAEGQTGMRGGEHEKACA